MPHAGLGTWMVHDGDPLTEPYYFTLEGDADEALEALGDGYVKDFIERKGL